MNAALIAIIDEHDVSTMYHQCTAADVLDHLGIEYDGAPESISATNDLVRLACVAVALMWTVRRIRAELVTDARDVPPVTLGEALAENAPVPVATTADEYLCADCDEQACVCWAYDDERPAPVDVHPANRSRDASYIRAAKARAERAAADAAKDAA